MIEEVDDPFLLAENDHRLALRNIRNSIVPGMMDNERRLTMFRNSIVQHPMDKPIVEHESENEPTSTKNSRKPQLKLDLIE